MAKDVKTNKFLTCNVWHNGSEIKKGTEIETSHPAYDSFEKDGWLVDSYALAMNEPEATAEALTDAEETIKELTAEIVSLKETNKAISDENKTLKTDLQDALDTIKELTAEKKTK